MKEPIYTLLLASMLFACTGKEINQVAKLNVPTLSVTESINGYEDRNRKLLLELAGMETTAEMVADSMEDIYSNRGIACLYLEKFDKAANERIRRSAEWFDHPHPGGRAHDGEPDFVAIKLCRAYFMFRDTDKLEPESLDRIRRFFFTSNFKSKHGSENHDLLFRTSRYLMAGAYPDSIFQAYRKTGKELAAKDRIWLRNFIQYRARRGWGEFDSPCYFKPEWECMLTLYDFSPDPDIRRLSGMMLDLLLTDMAVDSRNGMYCGAHGRIYAQHALDHRNENSYPLQYLYFGNADPETVKADDVLVDALVSAYRPEEIVVDIALNRNRIYINRERKHLHNVEDVMPANPLPGSIRKYTYHTPAFILGSIQWQDAYPDSCDGKWYAHHEQHEWDLSFTTRTSSRIFTHHPGTAGNEHGYWTGDLRCGCGHFFQHEGAALALYDIPEDQPLQFIHAYVPKESFDEVHEKNGYIFVREGEAYATLFMLNGYEWEVKTEQISFKSGMKGTTGWTFEGEWKDKEIISKGARNGAVCEAGLSSDYGSFEDFMMEIMNNRIEFDSINMRLTYHSRRYGTITLTTGGLHQINAEATNLDYHAYDSPFMQSQWDSGIIMIRKDHKYLKLDFMNIISDAG
jgi:hypothetical protein